jgi:hypothetical protein
LLLPAKCRQLSGQPLKNRLVSVFNRKIEQANAVRIDRLGDARAKSQNSLAKKPIGKSTIPFGCQPAGNE